MRGLRRCLTMMYFLYHFEWQLLLFVFENKNHLNMCIRQEINSIWWYKRRHGAIQVESWGGDEGNGEKKYFAELNKE